MTAEYPSVPNPNEGYEESEKVEFSALRGYGKFGTNSIQVVFDTGSGISIMSRKQATKLRLNIKKPKRLDVVTIGGIRSSVTGRVDNAPFMVMDIKAPIEKLYIVNTNDELTLLGNDWLTKYHADVLLSQNKLRLTAQGRQVDLTVTVTPVRLSYHLAGQYNRASHEAEVIYLGTETDNCASLEYDLPTKPS